MTSAPNSDFFEMRKTMVSSQLRPDSVSDQRVVVAFLEVPRHEFVPQESLALAYADAKVPIGSRRAMNPPVATARLINEANIGPEDHVLVVGAGRGYSTAVISRLAGSVVAVEQDAELAKVAMSMLADCSNVTVLEGALAAGSATTGPYDVILVDGGIEEFPNSLVQQLKADGCVAAAIHVDGVSRLSIGHIAGEGVTFRSFADSTTVALPGFARSKEFTF